MKNHPGIRASLLLVGHSAIVVWWMVTLFVLVNLDILALLLHVGLNVLWALIALKTKHAYTKNVRTLVLEHVAWMHDVKLWITILFVVVHLVLLAILSSDAWRKKVSTILEKHSCTFFFITIFYSMSRSILHWLILSFIWHETK